MKKDTKANATTQRRGQSDRVLLLGQMAAGIVHDAGNQLMLIQGALGLAQCQACSREDRRIMLAAQEAAATVGELLQEILSFIRPQKRSREEEEGIYADDEIERVMPLLRSSMGDGIIVDEELEAEDSRVRIGPVQLQNVLLNLLINARNAMHGVGRVRLHTCSCPSQNGQVWVMIVEDTGPGIPPELLESIFEPYYTGSSQGHGLGLMRCRMLVEQAGGRLWAQEHEGGALFRAELPVLEQQIPHREEPEIVFGSGFVGAALAPEREGVLLRMLRAMGYTPTDATDSRAQLVLIDDTAATESLLAKLPQQSPILVLCRSDSVPREQNRRVHLLPRPCTMAELSARIASLLTEKDI